MLFCLRRHIPGKKMLYIQSDVRHGDFGFHLMLKIEPSKLLVMM
jgi:hypothetical protein